MAVCDIFWNRQKRQRGEIPDVYTYTELPETLRVQCMQIMYEALGGDRAYAKYDEVEKTYMKIVNTLRKELGVLYISEYKGRIYKENYLFELSSFILREENVEKVLSAIELICQKMKVSNTKYDRNDGSYMAGFGEDAIKEINDRMRMAGVGYEYTNGEIIRIDSELVHTEAVKPALVLLQDKQYAGAEAEFLKAYEHYRKGNTKEALTEALKSIESTMKIICIKHKWAFNQNDTASKLIDICIQNNLIPSYWQTHFSGLRATLESGVPTARNRTSGHGQGVTLQDVPDYLAGYVLHMTASTIVFLIKAEKSLK